MERGTNSFPSFVKSMKFIEKDEKHIHTYLEIWANQVEGEKKPYDYLAPYGYGLIVFDMKRNQIYSLNGYSDIRDFHHFETLFRKEPAMEANFQELKQSGRLEHLEDLKDGTTEFYRIDFSPFALHTYTKNKEGYMKMMKDIQKNYTLSVDEISLWLQQIGKFDD